MIKINVIWPTFFWPLQHDSTIIERLRMRYTLCYIMIFVYQTSANFMVKYSVQYFRNHHFSAMNMNGYHYICFCHEGYDNLLGGTNFRLKCVKKTSHIVSIWNHYHHVYSSSLIGIMNIKGEDILCIYWSKHKHDKWFIQHFHTYPVN